MELKDITIEHLKNRPRQIIIVDFDNNKGHCLTFLVSDCEKPQVPGYPAIGLTYFNSVKDARKAIEDKYKVLNYYPKNKKHEGTFTNQS